MKPRALMLSPELPYPLQGGGALRTASLLTFLAQRHKVDLILFRHLDSQAPLESLPPGLVDRVLVLELPRHSRNPAARIIRNTRRLLQGTPPLVDRFQGFSRPIAQFVDGRQYRVAAIEHFWCAPYHSTIAPHAEHVVLDLHNVESELHRTESRAASSLFERIAHRRFGALYRRLEKHWLPKFSEVLTASEPDRDRVSTHCNRTTVFPNSIPYCPVPTVEEEEVIAFSGNFDYHPNQTAVAWFARFVWPELSAAYPAMRWRLIGMNPGSIRRHIRDLARVECTGPVADAVAELARAKVVVVPLQSGSGTRLKIIEAWAACRPVVSTPIGAEGLPGCNLLLADSNSFLDSLRSLLANPSHRATLAQRGREAFEQNHTWEAAWRTLADLNPK